LGFFILLFFIGSSITEAHIFLVSFFFLAKHYVSCYHM